MSGGCYIQTEHVFPVVQFGAMGPAVPAPDAIEEESVEEDEDERMSIIAQRVIDEAGQVGSENTLEAWQQRAEEVVGTSGLFTDSFFQKDSVYSYDLNLTP